MTDDEIDERFKRVLGLPERLAPVLESIRFQDQDQAAKGSAVLTFSALMIATSLVQFAAGKESLVYVGARNLVFLLSFLGLVLEFVASGLSIVGLVLDGKYSDDSRTALGQFQTHVSRRRKYLRLARWVTASGAILILVSLLMSLLGFDVVLPSLCWPDGLKGGDAIH